MGTVVETDRSTIISPMVTATMMDVKERLEEYTGRVHVPTLLWCIREGFLEERMSMWGSEEGTEMSDVGTS